MFFPGKSVVKESRQISDLAKITAVSYTHLDVYKRQIQMFDFFGGVTPMLVSDNCTTAVNHKKSDWYNTRCV